MKLREFFSKIRTLKFTVIVSITGLLLTASSAILGGGTPRQLFFQPRLYFTESQLATDSITLSSCTVENQGRAIAEEIIIQAHFEDGTLFADNIIVTGGEGREVVEAGGQVGDSYTRVYLDRLVGGHKVAIIITTQNPASLSCEVTSSGGRAVSVDEESDFGLIWGILLLLLGEVVSTVIISFVIWRKLQNKGEDGQANG